MGIVTLVTQDVCILPSAPNFRDLGGLRTETGRTVRTGLLYRSDALHSISEEDLPVYQGLGIRQLIDLRTPHERQNMPNLLPEGAEYAAVAVQKAEAAGANFAQTLTDPTRAREVFGNGGAERYMYGVYRGLATTPEAHDGYRDLVERTAKGPTAVVFHCSAGKDRTGWGAAVLLSLLGVDRKTIVEDYLRSNTRQANTDRWMRFLSERGGLEWEDVAPMTRVRAEYLQAAFTHVDEEYGSFDEYVSSALGLSSATLEALRERLLE